MSDSLKDKAELGDKHDGGADTGQAWAGTVRRAIFCDESGIGGAQKHYGFGALFMGYQRRGDFSADIKAIRAKHAFPYDEVKWNKCSRSNLSLHRDLVDYFFRSSSLSFHCIVVERAWVKIREYHGGSFDLARRKHFTQFLANKLATLAKVHHGQPLWTRVYVDRIASSYAKADEAVEIIGNRSICKLSGLETIVSDIKPIDSIIQCDSKDYNGIQLCDLLLGAVVDTWNDGSTSAAKGDLKQHIATYLGWKDLKSDTFPTERKFNVWWLTDKVNAGDARPVETRPVQLKHPLPVRRVHGGSHIARRR